MKAKLHFPTEQYGFAEIVLEVGSIEEALDSYNAIKSPELPPISNLEVGIDGGEGLPVKEWNRALDSYLQNGRMLSQDYEGMNDHQRNFIQIIKRSFNRTKRNA